MNNILSSKINSAIFLATLLVLGTISTILPSIQAQPYYEMDNSYDSYQPEPTYPNQNSYESQYGMESYDKSSYDEDNYEPREYPPKNQEREYNNYQPKYEMDTYETPSYGNNNYEQKEYPSYGKDKSKDSSSKSVSISKINCINTNLNLNGNNTGDINLGNKGRQGYSDSNSYGGGYYDGYDNNKQGKGFDCIINNNNTNTNIVIGGGGNITDGNGNETDACEECFNANATLAGIIEAKLALPGNITVSPALGLVIGANVTTIAELCDFLEDIFSQGKLGLTLNNVNVVINRILETGPQPSGASQASITVLAECLFDIFDGGTDNITRGIIPFDINTDTAGGLTASNINTAGDLAASFSSPSTIVQGTEENSSALEKIVKLKQQWLELLP